jgi:hypothetical protein
MKTSLIYVNIGDPVIHRIVDGYGRVREEKCTLVKIELVPNGIDDPRILCRLTVKTPRDTLLSATSEKFVTDPDFKYELMHK